jgi:hypothetical protein
MVPGRSGKCGKRRKNLLFTCHQQKENSSFTTLLFLFCIFLGKLIPAILCMHRCQLMTEYAQSLTSEKKMSEKGHFEDFAVEES